jgi:hypothetical protein
MPKRAVTIDRNQRSRSAEIAGHVRRNTQPLWFFALILKKAGYSGFWALVLK